MRVSAAAPWIERGGSEVTTLMIRNIPSKLTQDDLVGALESLGFGNRFDLLYVAWSGVPWKPANGNKGYAFVNFPNPLDAAHFSAVFNGVEFQRPNSTKTVEIGVAQHQGLRKSLRSMTLLHPSRFPVVRGAVAQAELANALAGSKRKSSLMRKLKANDGEEQSLAEVLQGTGNGNGFQDRWSSLEEATSVVDVEASTRAGHARSSSGTNCCISQSPICLDVRPGSTTRFAARS